MNFEAEATPESLQKSADKMMGARDDLLGDVPVEPFGIHAPPVSKKRIASDGPAIDAYPSSKTKHSTP